MASDNFESLSPYERKVLVRLGSHAPHTEVAPEMLAAYLDGRADTDEQQYVERALAADPLLRQTLAALRDALAEPATAAELARASALTAPFHGAPPRSRWQAWFGLPPLVTGAAAIATIVVGIAVGTALGTGAHNAETVTLAHFAFDWI